MRIRALLILLSLTAAACSGAAAAPDPVTTVVAEVPNSTTTTAAPTTTTSSTTTTTLDAGPPAPLTGLTGNLSDQQVLIAKLSNAIKGRPQAGINEADLVMEVLVEGGIGRWLAVFQSSYPESVGPLRSLREVDPKLLAPFDARVLSSGGQWAVRREVAEVAVDEGDGRIPGYRRESGRAYVYSLMYDTEKLPDLEWDGTVEPVLEFDIQAPAGGDEATEIDVTMSTRNQPSWTFDNGSYLRSQDGAESLDADDVPISADSLVVIFVRAISTGRYDASGSPVPDYEVTGSGEAIIFRNGRVLEGIWERETEDDFFAFRDTTDDPIPLMPGRTWIHLTPQAGSVTWR